MGSQHPSSYTPEHEAPLEPFVEGSEPDEPRLVLAGPDLYLGLGFDGCVVSAVYYHEGVGLGLQKLYGYAAVLGDDDAAEIAVGADGGEDGRFHIR